MRPSITALVVASSGLLSLAVLVFVVTPVSSPAVELPHARVMMVLTWLASATALVAVAAAVRQRRLGTAAGLLFLLLPAIGCAGLATDLMRQDLAWTRAEQAASSAP